jgi:hypothetical protein
MERDTGQLGLDDGDLFPTQVIGGLRLESHTGTTICTRTTVCDTSPIGVLLTRKWKGEEQKRVTPTKEITPVVANTHDTIQPIQARLYSGPSLPVIVRKLRSDKTFKNELAALSAYSTLMPPLKLHSYRPNDPLLVLLR